MPNLVTMTGCLASDLEMSYRETGTLGSTSIYVHVWDPDVKKDVAARFKIHFWNKLAERATQILKKGDKITIVGDLRLNSFTSNTGQMVEYYLINVTKFDKMYSAFFTQTGMISNLESSDRYYTFNLSSPQIKVVTNKMVALENGMVVSLAGTLTKLAEGKVPQIYADYLEVIK